MTTVTMSVTANGRTAPITTTVISYVDSNSVPVGYVSDNEYEVVAGVATIPATAKVNDSGIVFTANRYASSSKTTLLGTTETSFVLQADTASTAVVQLTRVDKNTSGVTTSTSISYSRITPAGGLTTLSESAVISFGGNTGALTFTYQ